MKTNETNKLQAKLYRAIKKYDLSSAEIVNYFYENFVKDGKFSSAEKYTFCLMSDRHSTTEEQIEPKIKARWLVNNRYELTT